MKYVLSFIIVLPLFVAAQHRKYNKVYFANSPMENNYFYSQASYKGPSWIKHVQGRLPVSDSVFYTPANSLELHYTSASGGNWEAMLLYRQLRGMDSLAAATLLQFKMFVHSETTAGELPKISMKRRRDSTFAVRTLSLERYVDVVKRNEWVSVEIPLADFAAPDSSNQADILMFSQPGNDGKEHRLFIDQVEFGSSSSDAPSRYTPKLLSARGYERHIDIAWEKIRDTAVKYILVYRSSNNKDFYPVGIQDPWISRYADFVDTIGKKFYYRIACFDDRYRLSPTSAIVSAETRRMNDEQLLDMVQESHFRYYWEAAEPNSGLALENIPGRRSMIASGASGFGISAMIAAVNRKFITRQEWIERMTRIVSFLERTETFHGAFAHFIDGNTGKAVPFFGQRDNGGDLVETSFLLQGLLAAMEYCDRGKPEERALAERINTIWKNVEWSWYRKNPSSKYLYWHWSPDQQWVIDHKLIGWNETLITYFLAIASPSHPVPVALYYSGFASQEAEAHEYRKNWGRTEDGSGFENNKTYFGIKLPVGVSNGGPLFFVHYSFMCLNPKSFSDKYTNYFTNNQRIAQINYRYCIENPEDHEGYGANAWGLTASDGLWGYSADEPVPHADHGKITPTGALASFPYTPKESMAALKNYYRNYGKFLWGEYGFRDAFNLNVNWCSEIYMGLNQAPIVVMIENYRSGLIWNLFMKNADVQNAIGKFGKQ